MKFSFFLILLLSITITANAQWHRVASKQCKISVSYPGQVNPQQRSNTMSDSVTVKEYRYLAAAKNHYFLTYCAVWPEGLLSGNLKKALQYGLAGIDGEIKDSKEIKLGTYPGHSFVIDLESGKGTTYVRIFIFKNVVVQMQSIQLAEEADQLSVQGKRFFKSLRNEDQ